MYAGGERMLGGPAEYGISCCRRGADMGGCPSGIAGRW